MSPLNIKIAESKMNKIILKIVFIILLQFMIIISTFSPSFSESPVKIVKEFISAAKSANFKKISELSCKDNGPFLTIDDAKSLDISNIGFIEEIIRQEKSEINLKQLYIVVARINFLRAISFKSFFVFKTTKGWRVHVDRNIMKDYPIDKLVAAKIAFSFYYSNTYIDEYLLLAKKIVMLQPNNVDAHLMLGKIYSEKGLKNDALDEFANALKIDYHYSEKRLEKKVLVDVWSILLRDTDEKVRFYAANNLYNNGIHNQTAIAVLIDYYKSQPNNVRSHVHLGWIFYKQGFKEKAFQEFARGFKIDKKFTNKFLDKRIKDKKVFNSLLNHPDKDIMIYAAKRLFNSGGDHEEFISGMPFFKTYIKTIYKEIHSKWQIPAYITQKKLEAIVTIKIKNNGKIISYNIETSSNTGLSHLQV